MVSALDADNRPKAEDFFLDLKQGVELNHVDDLRTAFRLPQAEKVGLKDL